MALDKMRSVDLRIDKANDYLVTKLLSKQGDYNGRELIVQITNGGVVENQITTQMNLGWRHLKHGNSGLDPFKLIDADKGLFGISYSEEMLRTGDVLCTVQIIQGGKLTETRNFNLEVEESPINKKLMVTQDSFKALEKALTQVNEWDGKFESKYAGLEEEYALELTTLKQETTAQFQQTDSFRLFYQNPKTGKKIVMVGDSTTEVAPAMYDRFAEYTKSGGLLDGATILNRGSNGNQLWQFVSGIAQNANTLNLTIADKADLYIVSYGINDIRGGLSSAGRTKEQIRADLKTLIDIYLNQTDGNVLLRTPNTFIKDSTASVYFDDPAKAQLYTDQLYEIYESFRGYDKRVDVIDIQNKVFGRKVLPFHSYMLNALHPNDNGYRAIADEIAGYISDSNKEVETNNEELILSGTIESVNSNDITIATNSFEEIRIGDILLVGNGGSFIVNEQPLFLGGKWKIKHSDMNFSNYGKVRVIRNKNKVSLITTDKNVSNDWIRAKFIGANIGYIQYVVDLQNFHLSGTSRFNLDFSYFTDSTNIENIPLSVWFNQNASPDTITGGLQMEIVARNVMPGEMNKMGYTFDKNIEGNRYMHVLITSYRTDALETTVEIGDFKFNVDGAFFPFNYVPTLYASDPRSTLEKNITQRGVIATKKYVDKLYQEILARLTKSGI